MTRTFVPPGVMSGLQVLLVVVLGIPPLAGGQDFRDNLALPPFLVDELGYLLGRLLLLGVVVEDAGAVLRASVRALAVQRRGVVHAVEEFQEFLVCDLRWVVSYLESFGVWSQEKDVSTGSYSEGEETRVSHTSGIPTAHGAVAWVLCVPADISHSRIIEALAGEVFPVQVLDAPEASRSDGGFGGTLGAQD
jgi:hypothetical protein